MHVKDVMSHKPEFLPPDATLKKAAEQMRSHDYGFMPVGENDRLIGAVTDRDITIRCVAEGKDPNKTLLRDVMSDGIYFCFEDDDLKKAVERMQKLKVRRLVVLNKAKRMIGILSLGDIATKSKNDKLCAEVTESVSQE